MRGRPGADRRRRRAPGLAVRRPRPELRGRRRGERRLEDRVRRARLGAGGAARQLPRRAARRGGGEHRGHHGDDGVPRPAARAAEAAPPGRRPRAGGHRPGGPGARRLRPARRAVLVRRLAADDPGPEPAVRRPPAARRGARRRARGAGARLPGHASPAGRTSRRLRELARDGFLLLADDGVDAPPCRAAAAAAGRRSASTRWPRSTRRHPRPPPWTPAPARCGSSGRTRTSPPCSPTDPEPTRSPRRCTAPHRPPRRRPRGEPRWRTTGRSVSVPPKRHTQHRTPRRRPLLRGADGRGGLLLGLVAALPPRRAVGDRRRHARGSCPTRRHRRTPRCCRGT